MRYSPAGRDDVPFVELSLSSSLSLFFCGFFRGIVTSPGSRFFVNSFLFFASVLSGLLFSSQQDFLQCLQNLSIVFTLGPPSGLDKDLFA